MKFFKGHTTITFLLLAVAFVSMGLKWNTRSSSSERIDKLKNEIDFLEKENASKDKRIEWLIKEYDAKEKEWKEKYENLKDSYESKINNQSMQIAASDDWLSKSNTSSAPTVIQIQQALKNAGFYEGPLSGYMGPLTQEAIREFQSGNTLINDGYVGEETWMKLKGHLRKTLKNDKDRVNKTEVNPSANGGYVGEKKWMKSSLNSWKKDDRAKEASTVQADGTLIGKDYMGEETWMKSKPHLQGKKN